MLALARMLAARTPAARVTRTLSGHVLALSVRVTAAPLLAVGAPELARALCKNPGGGRERGDNLVVSLHTPHPLLCNSQPPKANLAPICLLVISLVSLQAVQHPTPPSPALTSVAVGTKVAMTAAALSWPHAHLVF